MRTTGRNQHIQIQLPNGTWKHYCSGIAACVNHVSIPSIMEVMCMEGRYGPSLEEMVKTAKAHGLTVRIANGVCPTLED